MAGWEAANQIMPAIATARKTIIPYLLRGMHDPSLTLPRSV